MPRRPHVALPPTEAPCTTAMGSEADSLRDATACGYPALPNWREAGRRGLVPWLWRWQWLPPPACTLCLPLPYTLLPSQNGTKHRRTQEEQHPGECPGLLTRRRNHCCHYDANNIGGIGHATNQPRDSQCNKLMMHPDIRRELLLTAPLPTPQAPNLRLP